MMIFGLFDMVHLFGSHMEDDFLCLTHILRRKCVVDNFANMSLSGLSHSLVIFFPNLVV